MALRQAQRDFLVSIDSFSNHRITSAHHQISTSARQHVNTSSHQQIIASKHQHINTSTHHQINTSTINFLPPREQHRHDKKGNQCDQHSAETRDCHWDHNITSTTCGR